MRPPQRRRTIPVLSAGLVAAATVLAAGAASSPAVAGTSATAAPGPVIKLIVAQKTITLQRFGTEVELDPGIWVAAEGAPLRLNVSRSGYTRALHITEVVRGPHGGTRQRRLPHWTAVGWNGLRDFARLTVRSPGGKLRYTSQITFCPDSYTPARTGPDSATTSPYPTQCGSGDPFPLTEVWGLAKGWATDPAQQFGPNAKLGLGTYRATETVSPAYRRLFHMPWRASHATVTLKVVKGTGCCGLLGPAHRTAPAAARPLPSLPHVRTLSRAPADALPDLVPLPSWGLSTSAVKNTQQDFLNFGATVWVGGTSPLDVEGFRQAGSPVMHAYQYFWKNGKIVGRVRAGTMGFDSEKGHNHWHFEQFARYQLLGAGKKLAVRSEKVGFCIAPTDGVNLLLPHATWQPSFIGLGGQCGSPTALWVQELMPVGWGDTYDQYKAGQAFNITKLANGTYYVEIIANPEHVLHEVSTANDISLRKVILGGTPGHRTVRVPAYDGINPER
jgi:hypothetical protein